MSADEAFDNLLNKNALAIPVVRRAGETDVSGMAEGSRPPRRAPDREEGERSMRVPGMMDDEPSDYHPGAYGFDGEGRPGGVYDHPTVTDLDPIADEEDDVDNAWVQGARVAGRDAGQDGDEYAGDAYLEDDAHAAEMAGDSVLGMARRVQRFSYLPLEGTGGFEAGAREMAAALIALHPERPSLAVTSAARGEGRTELAIRLALAMAKRVGFRVLLADFDVRNPRTGARLGVSSKYFTLSDVLRGACPLGEALVASEEDNLYVLPSRQSDRDGDEILDGRQVQGLLGQLHSTFDFILFDCGPVTHADAVLVCRLAGGAAIAGRCGTSSAPAMNAAARRLEEAEARVAGVLLTNCR